MNSSSNMHSWFNKRVRRFVNIIKRIDYSMYVIIVYRGEPLVPFFAEFLLVKNNLIVYPMILSKLNNTFLQTSQHVVVDIIDRFDFHQNDSKIRQLN